MCHWLETECTSFTTCINNHNEDNLIHSPSDGFVYYTEVNLHKIFSHLTEYEQYYLLKSEYVTCDGGLLGDIGLASCCIVWCCFFFFGGFPGFGVQLVALTADDSDCVGVCKWMCPWLYWNGFKKKTWLHFQRVCFVGWKRALPIFMWDAFCRTMAESCQWSFQKTYFLSLPSSYIFFFFCFDYSLLWVRRFLSGAYRAIISMRC